MGIPVVFSQNQAFGRRSLNMLSTYHHQGLVPTLDLQTQGFSGLHITSSPTTNQARQAQAISTCRPVAGHKREIHVNIASGLLLQTNTTLLYDCLRYCLLSLLNKTPYIYNSTTTKMQTAYRLGPLHLGSTFHFLVSVFLFQIHLLLSGVLAIFLLRLPFPPRAALRLAGIAVTTSLMVGAFK